jgi:hypothetical protein
VVYGSKWCKKLRLYSRIQGAIDNFNELYGERIVSTIKRQDVEDYWNKQVETKKAPAPPATVDYELSIVGAMINKACEFNKGQTRTKHLETSKSSLNLDQMHVIEFSA